MSVARVRVEAKRLSPNPSRQEREKSCVSLLRALKRACDDYGINHAYKEHQYFIRKTDKRRQKESLKKYAARFGWKDKEINQY